jgi:hypothetical protein
MKIEAMKVDKKIRSSERSQIHSHAGASSRAGNSEREEVSIEVSDMSAQDLVAIAGANTIQRWKGKEHDNTYPGTHET